MFRRLFPLVIAHVALFVNYGSTSSSGCKNGDTCSSHNKGMIINLSVGPYQDQQCSAYYWICPPTVPICVHCNRGFCFNSNGSTSKPGPGYPCAPCYQLPECASTSSGFSTTTTTQPLPVYQEYLPNTVSKCTSAGMPAYVIPDTGVIVESPNYPIFYDYSSSCVWNVILYHPELYESVKIYVNSTFDIRDGDFLMIDGVIIENSAPREMTVKNFTIELISDYSNSGKGFSFYIHGVRTNAPSTTNTNTLSTVGLANRTSIYIMGGYGDNDWSYSAYRIVPGTGTVKAYDIEDRTYYGEMSAAALANGTVMFCSYYGYAGCGLWEHTTNRVTPIAEIPNVYYTDEAPASAVITGSKFVNCGYSNTIGYSICVVYDLVTGENRVIPIIGDDASKYRGCTAEYGDNRHILFIGGTTSSVLLIDTVTGTYSTVATLPESRIGHSCILLGSSVVVCGGSGISTCITLSIPSMAWATFPSMTTVRRWFQLVKYDGNLMAIGGYNGGWLSSIEVFDFSNCCLAWALWNQQLPVTLAMFGAATVNEDY